MVWRVFHEPMFRSCCAGRWVGLISFGAWGQTVNRSHPLETAPGQKYVGEPPTKVELAKSDPPPPRELSRNRNLELGSLHQESQASGLPSSHQQKVPHPHCSSQRPCLHKATQAALYSLLLRPVQLSSVTRTCDPSIHLIFHTSLLSFPSKQNVP